MSKSTIKGILRGLVTIGALALPLIDGVLSAKEQDEEIKRAVQEALAEQKGEE